MNLILKRIMALMVLFGAVFSFGASFSINNVSINENNSGRWNENF